MNKVTKGVYCLTFPNGKRYVGVGCSKGGIPERWKKYLYLTCKSQPKLYNALKKHGTENVKFEVILETDDVDNALRSEMYLIDVWNLQDIRYGYNITDGGRGNNHIQAKIRKIKNTITGEIIEGCLKQLGRDLNQNVDSFRTSMKKYGKYRDWILLDGH